ncbi:GroES-like protein [Periconia macrospinosa]|uniref:GroES-like protein n=1 Tax=Periconia macrospinosa TaxID=97972 RepID=A0A2V1DJM1_9PLEO|nr:GroES-like protein [Periconia macrospinosa]
MSSQVRTMRAVLWEGEVEHVSVKDVPVPTIRHPEDVIVRITSAALCGTDLHIYSGELGSSTTPWILGHEGIGIVTAVGSAVDVFKVGDKVVVPDAPSSGELEVEGSASLYSNIHAEYVRVTFADDSLIKIPDTPGTDDRDYLLLSDIWPTAWTCLNLSGFQPGDSVAVFGAGPLGLLCAYSALLRGASIVYSIDHVTSRLNVAKSIGAVPIDFTKGDPATQILAMRPLGVHRVCECVGAGAALNPKLEHQPDYIINQAVAMASVNGGIGIIGGYAALPDTEGTPRGHNIPAKISFPISELQGKALTMSGAAVDAKLVWPQLLGLLETGRAHPSFVFSDEIDIEEAPKAYERFFKRREIKTLIKFDWNKNKEF